MYACIHTYIHASIHTYIHASTVYAYIHAYKHTNIRTYIHTHGHTYIHTCVQELDAEHAKCSNTTLPGVAYMGLYQVPQTFLVSGCVRVRGLVYGEGREEVEACVCVRMCACE